MGSTVATARSKILLVDDDQDFLELYWEILKRLPSGPEVHTASSGARALALLESEPFNLLIVDLNMPKMDGLQVIAIARREMRGYFDSPVAYIVVVAFLLVAGWMVFGSLFLLDRADLRGYHAAMGKLIFDFDGTLERFAGDGIMVFFNDPIPCADHTEKAVRMALAMQSKVEELRAEWLKKGYELDLGIGMAAGYATLGNIGFEGRMDYGAIGNVTNLAAKLLALEARPDSPTAGHREEPHLAIARLAAEDHEHRLRVGTGQPFGFGHRRSGSFM